MKPLTTTKATVASGIAALLLSPAFAIEAPEDNAPPPVEDAPRQIPNADAGQKADEDQPAKPFLGVLTTPIPDMVAEHLGIGPGQGVAVKTVVPDAPAAKAGIQANDIITRIADKPVSSHADILDIIGGHKPGDSIRLDLIQKGKARNLDVTLGTRPAGADVPDEAAPPLLDDLPLDGIPKEMADRIRDNIKGNLGGMKLQFRNLRDGGVAPGNLDELRKQMGNMEGMMDFKGLLNMQGGFQSSMRFKDGEGSVEMKSGNDGKEITVRDLDGKVLWSGPWDTEQDKQAAPPKIRERIDAFKLDQGGMFKIEPGMIRPKAAPRQDGQAEDAEDANKPE
jgi:serine protease Do